MGEAYDDMDATRAPSWKELCLQAERERDTARAERDKYREQLDTLRAAIGDPDQLRQWVTEHNSIKLRQTCERIAAAVPQDPEESP